MPLTAQTRLGVKINKLPDLPRAKTRKVRKRGIIGKSQCLAWRDGNKGQL